MKRFESDTLESEYEILTLWIDSLSSLLCEKTNQRGVTSIFLKLLVAYCIIVRDDSNCELLLSDFREMCHSMRIISLSSSFFIIGFLSTIIVIFHLARIVCVYFCCAPQQRTYSLKCPPFIRIFKFECYVRPNGKQFIYIHALKPNHVCMTHWFTFNWIFLYVISVCRCAHTFNLTDLWYRFGTHGAAFWHVCVNIYTEPRVKL